MEKNILFFTLSGCTWAFFLSATTLCCNMCTTQISLRNPYSTAGIAGLIVSPLSSCRAQPQAIPQQKVREDHYHNWILNATSPTFPGCLVVLKEFLSILIWWRPDVMSSSLSLYILSAQYILWDCVSLGAVLVTPHFVQPSATSPTSNILRVLLGLAKSCLRFMETWSMQKSHHNFL